MSMFFSSFPSFFPFLLPPPALSFSFFFTSFLLPFLSSPPSLPLLHPSVLLSFFYASLCPFFLHPSLPPFLLFSILASFSPCLPSSFYSFYSFYSFFSFPLLHLSILPLVLLICSISVNEEKAIKGKKSKLFRTGQIGIFHVSPCLE